MVGTEIKTRIIAGFSDEATWERLLDSSESDSVFMTREWLAAWWETFGHGELLLVGAERDGEIVAVAPFYTQDGIVYFVGSGYESYELGFVGDARDPLVVEALLLGAREVVEGFIGFELYFVSSTLQERLERAAAGLGLDANEEWRVSSMTMDLQSHPELARAATRKKSLVRHENYFRREGGLSVVHANRADEVLPWLDELYAQHIERWAATDSPSQFLDEKWRVFFQRWAVSAANRGWLRFTRLEWQGRSIAFHFGVCYRGNYIWYKPCFAVDLARHSPGEVLLRQTLLAAIEEGAKSFDFGTGDDVYKTRFATDTREMRGLGLYPR
jgi:CelD/BcsL family acetyltransferase involved in cellulose biosynthesis